MTKGGSRDRTKSPATVSRKREYSQDWPETFGSLAAENGGTRVWRLPASGKSPLLAGSSAIPRNPLLNGGRYRTGKLPITGRRFLLPCRFRLAGEIQADEIAVGAAGFQHRFHRRRRYRQIEEAQRSLVRLQLPRHSHALLRI